ncbi:MAG: 30S ribosomal protein S11 [SAR324 cluster bacterium]|nr:30S ribosomal protein S11 [SAR324 cluster bacterium]
MSKKKTTKRKERKISSHAIVFINATFNNTLVSITTPVGDVITWSSTGLHGFKGSRKGTPYAAKLSGESAIRNALALGVKSVDIKINGPGSGRESALRAVAIEGIKINSITDVTPVPHNGCRPPKRRRM